MKRKNLRKILTLLSIGMLFLFACGNNEGTANEDNDTEAQSSMPGNRPFTYVAQQPVGTIDPAKVVDDTETITALNYYDALIYPERTDGSIAPSAHLASEYEVSEDGLVYTLTLRDDVNFHSGNQLSANDVVYSMERMLAIGQGNSWLWQGLFADDGVNALDEYTVEFTLNEPYAPFLSSLTQLYVVDAQLLQENEEDGDYGQAFLNDNEAGSGPYTLGEWNRESHISFEAFEDYWLGWEENQIQDAEMLFIEEESTMKSLLSSGQADMVNQNLNPTAYEEFKEQTGIVVEESESSTLQEIAFNTQKTPTDDINLRKAISLAFDYSVANEQIHSGSTQAAGPVPISVDGHSEDVTVYEQDVEKAKQLLAESNYSGEPLTFVYIGDIAWHRQYSQLVASNLEDIGITVELQASTWPQMTEMVTSVETSPHMILLTDSLVYPHVDSHTFGKYHPSTHGNYRSAPFLDNTEVTETLDKARKATSIEEQTKYYKEAQNLITELTPSIYISNQMHQIAFRDYVGNYTYVPLMGYDADFYYLTVE